MTPLRRGSGRLAGLLLVLALLTAQTASAASYPLTIPFGRSWPISVVVDSTRGLVYFDASSGDYPPTGFLFGVINVSDHTVVRTLALNEIPGPMALDQASGDVYIAGNDSIRVYDAANQTMGRRIGVGHPLISLAHDGKVSRDIFIAAGNQVFAIDPTTGRVVGNATVGNGANGMAIDPATGRLFVAEYPDAEIFVFQVQNLSPMGVISLPACCANQLAVDSRTHILFATTRTGYVDVVNAQRDAFVSRLMVAPSLQNSTNTAAVDNGTGRAFVSSSPGGSIVELDGSGSAVIGVFSVESQVAGMAVDYRTHELYVTDYHQVTVLDVSRGRLLLLGLVLVAAAVVAVAAVALVVILRKRRPPQ